MVLRSLILSIVICLVFFAQSDARPPLVDPPAIAGRVRAIITVSDEKVDFAKAKLAFDRIIDPETDERLALQQIERMYGAIKAAAGKSASDVEKLSALRKFLYEGGAWNDHKPFGYDLTDPFGSKLTNKLLSTYLSTRRGNCVSMPFLFIILGDRLGLKVTAALAPGHILVKYTDNTTGKTYNLETTSGAHPARDIWYRQNMSMTDDAIQNGAYMRALTKKETLALMASTVMEYLMEQGRYAEASKVADVILESYPTFINALLARGTVSMRLVEDNFRKRYPTVQDMPRDVRIQYRTLMEGLSEEYFAKAEALGWRETDGRKQ